jgi:FAD/FMN-containing dehydrogenase
LAEHEKRLKALSDVLGSEYVQSDPETLSGFEVDGMRPRFVVFPSDVEQVSNIVRIAHREKMSVIPWGSGSKVSTGQVPSRLDLIICTRRLDKVIDMDTANLTVTAQAGVRLKDLQADLADEENRCYLPYEDATTLSDEAVCSDRENVGCFIPLTPPRIDSATIGGIIASNSSGPTRLLYGMPRDLVLGIRYVSPDGEIVGMGGKTVKNVSGYDISKLMIGARGSLGILCEMTLRLLPLPECVGTSIVSFSSLSKAVTYTQRIFDSDLIPAAVELFNRSCLPLLYQKAGFDSAPGDYLVALGLESFEEPVQRMSAEIDSMASEIGSESTLTYADDDHRSFWYDYSNLPSRLLDHHPDVVSAKISVPISNTSRVIDYIESHVTGITGEHLILSHAGNGVLHLHLLGEQSVAACEAELISFIKDLLDESLTLGGNLVVERASPELKKSLPVWGIPGNDLMVMAWIKKEMDPHGLFCPGRFVGGI